MTKLLKESVDLIESRGHSVDDVQFVKSNTDAWGDAEWQWCTWAQFAERADFDYDAGFGGEVISLSLVIVGPDWWLERHEYDGSEWWAYKTLPVKPETYNPRLRIKYHEDED
ncbi:MAG: hypothetical protein M3457_02195 [Chloroflexota bacterium]|nr:hypothetical protein [Chloroflexota bacterium]